jgi:hypothetical protein
MPGKDPGGIVVTLALGLAGSFLGALILLGIYRVAIGRGLGRHDRRLERRTPA